PPWTPHTLAPTHALHASCFVVHHTAAPRRWRSRPCSTPSLQRPPPSAACGAAYGHGPVPEALPRWGCPAARPTHATPAPTIAASCRPTLAAAPAGYTL